MPRRKKDSELSGPLAPRAEEDSLVSTVYPILQGSPKFELEIMLTGSWSLFLAWTNTHVSFYHPPASQLLNEWRYQSQRHSTSTSGHLEFFLVSRAFTTYMVIILNSYFGVAAAWMLDLKKGNGKASNFPRDPHQSSFLLVRPRVSIQEPCDGLFHNYHTRNMIWFFSCAWCSVWVENGMSILRWRSRNGTITMMGMKKNWHWTTLR